MEYLKETSCASCHGEVTVRKQPKITWPSTVLGILVFILPKCPFCVVAYTSSMAICGAPSIVNHHTDWGAWLAVGLAVVCIGSIARNYRGSGTRTAIVIALLGLAFLLAGLLTPNAMIWYYLGATCLFLGSLYNGRGYRWLSKIVN